MLLKTKEELNGAARIILNNLDELYMSGLNDSHDTRPAQHVLESEEWVHIYNLAQRTLFINNNDPHFGVLGELEALAKEQASDNGFTLLYTISDGAIIIQYLNINTRHVDYNLEFWSLDRSIRGLKLNMPSGN
jgi:hypothetical protein